MDKSTDQPITERAAERYAAGRRFRVVREGASLRGMKPEPLLRNTYSGWSRPLAVGEIITSTGFGPGWGSDPGYGIHWQQPGISHAEFRPQQGGMWNYHPADGYLEPVDDSEGHQ